MSATSRPVPGAGPGPGRAVPAGDAPGGCAPDLVVVVVSYGSSALLAGTLDTPAAPVPSGVRVVVVDNRSTDAERDAVTRLAGERGWELVAMPGNRGFGHGANAGTARAVELGAHAVLFLNPDAVVSPAVLAALRDHLAAHPGELVSPVVDDPVTGVRWRGSVVELADGRTRGLRAAAAVGTTPGADGSPGGPVLDVGAAAGPGRTGWLTAACLGVPVPVLTRVGGFEESFGMYWEDVDLTVRAAAAGARLVVRTDLVVGHASGGTQGPRRGRARSDLYYRSNARNRLRFATRHLDRRGVLRWVAATPAAGREILLRGGRRQLIASTGPLRSVVSGSASGAALALAALAGVGPWATDRRHRSGAAPAAAALGRAPRVTVAVLTYRRPHDLAAVVPLVLDQLAGVAAAGAASAPRLLVVDNDAAGSGCESFRAVRTAGGSRPGVTGGVQVASVADVRVDCVVEPEPGIAAARNRALDEAGDTDLLVFLDDDERPQPGWLAALLATRAATGADAVAGAVVSRFAAPLDPWIAAGGFFARRRPPTGTDVATAATNNLLLDLAAVRGRDLRFDPALGLAGGSDTAFTRSLSRSGGRIVWCDEAVVTDVVPAARATRGWVLRRAWRSGNSSVVVDVGLAAGPVARARTRFAGAARGLPRLAGGGARWAGGALTGSRADRARGLRTAARGGGMVAGALGRSYAEYRRPVGGPS